jgi:putative FmdB family regulatory protein
MPTYDYKCEACDHTFEKFHSITADPVRKCPVCGKRKVRRLIGTGAGLIFKGSGFYITDYRSESYKSAAKADSGSTSTESKATEKSPASKETAAAPKPESKPAESKPAHKARKDSAKR